MYIYEQSEWPEFTWDVERINELVIQTRHLQGRLLGGMESVGFHLQDITLLETLTEDVVKSSEIEGEFLDNEMVRSSVARHLGIEEAAVSAVDKNIEGVVEMMLNATQSFGAPLTQERLLQWHRDLFPMGRSGWSTINVGAWRKGPVQVVSGHLGREIVHFEGPPGERIEKEMGVFLDWLNSDTKMDFVLKAAVAHLWFETIHPFEDGNGRIGRAIVDMLLARSEKSARRFYSLSSQIQLERKHYYAILEKTQKGELDISPWIEWFLGCLGRAIQKALLSLQTVLKKAQFWDSHDNLGLNPRQKKVINQLLEGFEGKLTTSKWAKITKCSQDTAYRDILDLLEKEILTKNPEGGRSTSYSLSDIK